MTILSDLEDSLATTPRLARDAVATTLAKRYAEALDECFTDLLAMMRECPSCAGHFEPSDAAEDGASHARLVLEISRLGARLEAMLDRLGMAPGSRPALRGDGGERGDDPAARALEQLQRDAASGAPSSGLDYAAAVDPSVTEADTED